ncbi:MAG: flagellar biosynthetic protein FliO [Clostridiales Family XIII bacterium]|nr:flagellar biosynthetic protein FliO [Clostridiales Family XIII bacterium]
MWQNNSVLSLALGLIGIAAVLVLTYFASRWYAGKVGPIAAGRYIRIVDRVVVGKTSSILILELEKKQYLVSVSEQGVSILKELETPIKAEGNPRGQIFHFRDLTFREVIGKYGKRKGEDR